jgi:DNA gyrase subunit A
VWKLPEGGPQTRGRPMINLLPLANGETITNVLPLPEDEAEWEKLHIFFATAKGSVRRNGMGQFTNIRASGKIAMEFEEGSEDRLIGVALLTEGDDVLLATKGGKAIRFAATDIREFQSRKSTGVRGMTLKGDDEVISLSILQGLDATSDERDAYLRAAPWKDNENEATLPADRIAELSAVEDFILTVCENGYGKRSSAYEYRQTGRGGQGITNIDNLSRNGTVVASFPAHDGEELMLVTNQAKLIRMKVGDLRVIGRNSAGVKLFDVAKGEIVVGAARIQEGDGEEEGEVDALPEAVTDSEPAAE